MLAFDLRANPTVTRYDGVTAQAKRHDVVMDRKKQLGPDRSQTNPEIWEAAGRDWLSARAAGLGISLVPAAFRADGYRLHRFRRPAGGDAVRFASLDLSGVLRVEDAERLRAALFAGVGRARARGCGLLLIKRT
jgi:CRISPR system Cascade subunit CasE